MSRPFRRTSGGSSTFSTATTTPRSVAALTRSASHDVFASADTRGADRASMKCALKIRVPIGASASMNPTNFARSAWWKWDGEVGGLQGELLREVFRLVLQRGGLERHPRQIELRVVEPGFPQL